MSFEADSMTDQASASITLINPNTSASVTTAMVKIARGVLPPDIEITGMTASVGPQTITQPDDLARSAAEVVRLGRQATTSCEHPVALIVAAFGDPGLEQLRKQVRAPAIGFAQASIEEACRGGRRFGIATTTPALKAAMLQRVIAYGAVELFAGFRFTTSDPLFLMTAEGQLSKELAAAAQKSASEDGADVVIIGGGPLAQVAAQLQADLDVPLVAPVAAATRAAIRALKGDLSIRLE